MNQLFAKAPKQVRIVEVGPRDGLQNEAVILSTEDKLHLVELLAASGLTEIELSSFVNPKRVPQLADAADLFRLVSNQSWMRYSALVPNERGLERAIDAGARAIALFTAASETFTSRNIGMQIGQSLELFRTLTAKAHTKGMRVRAYVSTAFVCPFEGYISPSKVVEVVRALVDMGVDEVSLGDTIGHAVPTDIATLLEALSGVLPLAQTACHFHDTRRMALANTLVALQYGVSIIDSSVGGTGGCPFAPGAAGNLATEDLLVMLNGMEIETDVNVEKVSVASRFLESKLGHSLRNTAR